MHAESLMILLAGIGAEFMTAALLADLCGMRITCALACGLAAWSWLAACNLALAPHGSRPEIAMRTDPPAETVGAKWLLRITPMPTGKRLFWRYYEGSNHDQ